MRKFSNFLAFLEKFFYLALVIVALCSISIRFSTTAFGAYVTSSGSPTYSGSSSSGSTATSGSVSNPVSSGSVASVSSGSTNSSSGSTSPTSNTTTNVSHTGASNLLTNMGATSPMSATTTSAVANSLGTNQQYYVNELHVVTANSTMTTAAYQPYISCPNKGKYVLGSLTQMGSNTMFYFCELPMFSWYLSTTSPVYYDTGHTLTYAALQSGFVNNPSMPAAGAAIASEKITTAALYQNGVPLTTFVTWNCTTAWNPYVGFYTSASNHDSTGMYVIAYGNTKFNLGVGSETDTGASGSFSNPGQSFVPSNNNNLTNYCFLRPTATAPVIAGEVLNISVTNSNAIFGMIATPNQARSVGASSSPSTGVIQGTTIQQSNWAGSMPCTGSYTVNSSDVGNTVYFLCGCTNNVSGYRMANNECSSTGITYYGNSSTGTGLFSTNIFTTLFNNSNGIQYQSFG